VTKNKKILVAIVLVIIIAVAGSFLIFHDTSMVVSTKKPAHKTTSSKKTAQNNTKPKKATQTSSNPVSPTNNPTPVAPSNSSSGNNNSTLTAPFGSFVSNHNPNLNNSAQDFELSSCETTAGASCYIAFTNNSGSTISLPTETTDTQGVASWNWYVSDKGFTVGTWHIKAVATLNGQTKTTSDPDAFNVTS